MPRISDWARFDSRGSLARAGATAAHAHGGIAGPDELGSAGHHLDHVRHRLLLDRDPVAVARDRATMHQAPCQAPLS